jgi:hypothetical protein
MELIEADHKAKMLPNPRWEALNAIAQKVLAYRPKPKTKVAKRRKRRAKKAQNAPA